MEMNMENPSSDIVPKEGIFSRMISRWTEFPLIVKILSALLLFSVLGSGLYLSIMQKSQIAYIAPPTPATPPYASASPSPFPSAASCVSRVYSAEISHSCSRQGFFNIKYQCDDGRSFVIGDGKMCIDLMDAAIQADQKCGSICKVTLSSPTPWPSPSMPTSPKPSLKPSIKPSIKPSFTPTPKPSYLPSPSPTPTATATSTAYPSPTVVPSATPKPPTCINFFGRKICWPGIRPPLD